MNGGVEQVLEAISTLVSVAITLTFETNLAYTLPMRGRRAYLVVAYLGAVAVIAVRSVLPLLSQLHFVVCALLLPLVLLRGSRGQRLVAIALNLGLLFMGEFLTAAMVLIFAGGMPYTSFAHEHVVVMLVFRTVYLMMMVAGGLGIRAFVARWTRGERIDFVLPRFALGVLLHVCLAIGFYYILTLLAIPASDPLCVVGMLLSVFAVPLDAGLLWSLERARRAAAADARARVAGERLEACLARYGRVSRATVRTAQLRHDARAHLQAVAALVAEGDPARAEGYARETAALLRADDYGAYGLWDAGGDAAGELPHESAVAGGEKSKVTALSPGTHKADGPSPEPQGGGGPC